VNAFHARHFQIHQNKVRRQLAGHFDSLTTLVGRPDNLNRRRGVENHP
jgi:hypothetical protein